MLAPAPFGTVMGEVKNFIMGQPAATHIAVGYIRDNVTVLAQDFTDRHELAAKAIRLPLGTGAIGSSPYLGTMDLLKRWPQTGPRRSIVLISSGIDFFRGRESQISIQIWTASLRGHNGRTLISGACITPVLVIALGDPIFY